MAAAIELSKLGVAADLVEIDTDWRSYGAGITIGGPTLRAFGTIGVLDEIPSRGSRTVVGSAAVWSSRTPAALENWRYLEATRTRARKSCAIQ